MEKDLNELKTTNDIILSENNDSNTVATIYCTRNGSKLFKSSRSFAQTRLVDQCSFNFSELTQPNFCELNIIAKNEKVDTMINFFPLQTTSAKLKEISMVSKIPGESRIFRRTVENFDEEMNQKSSEVMNFKRLLKNSDSISDGMFETNTNIKNLKTINKTEKQGNMKHKLQASVQKRNEQKRKRNIVHNDNPIPTNFIDNTEIMQKYDNLVHAKTMYFANLPNKVDTTKTKRKDSKFGADTGKDVVGTNDKIRKSTVSENESKNNAVEEMKKVVNTNCISESIEINKIENDISQWSSVNSQSTLCMAKGRTVSEISVNDSIYSNEKSNSKRIHNNSPISDTTIQEKMENMDKQSRKIRQKKRHENSKQASSDEDENKLTTKISDFGKGKAKKETQKDTRKNRSRKKSSAGKVGKRSTQSERNSNEIKNDEHILNILENNVQKKEQNYFLKNTSQFDITKNPRKTDNGNHSEKQKYSRHVIRKKHMNPEINSSETESEYHHNIFKENIDTKEINIPDKNKSQCREFKINIKNKTPDVGRQVNLRKRNYLWHTNQSKKIKLEISSTVSRNTNKRENNERDKKDLDQAGLETNAIKTNNGYSVVIDGVLPEKKIQNLQNNKKTSTLQPISKITENEQSNRNSVLKLYFVDTLAPSTSSMKLTDDLLLKLKKEKRKNTLLKFSGKRQSCASPVTNNQVEKEKRRSKSRLTKEKHYKSKIRHEVKPDVENQKFRKCTSDVSNKRCVKNFDNCISVEGKFESEQKKQIDSSSKIKKVKSDKPFKDTAAIIYDTKKPNISISLSSKTFQDNRPKYSTKKSCWTEDISSIMERFSRKTSQQKNRIWSKSCTRKKSEFVCQYSEKENKTKSDTSVNRKISESKRSKSLIIKGRIRPSLPNQSSVIQSSFEKKVYEELYTLGTYQNIKANNRFKVISKPIHNKDSSTINKNDEYLVSGMKIYKLKPHPSSEKEKKAILNLPMFRRTDTIDSSVKNTNQNISFAKLQTTSDVRKKRRNKITMTNKFSSSTSEEETLKLLDEKKSKNRMKKTSFRREVSFTHLNVVPVQELYRKQSKISSTKTSFSPNIAVSTKMERLNVVLGKGFVYKSQKTQEAHPILFKRNVDDRVSEKKTCNRKLSFFHLIPDENFLEISTRVTDNDGSTMIGFTVSGTEPPKRLRCENVEKIVSKKSGKLQMTLLPPIKVNEQNSGFGNTVLTFNHPTTNKEYFENPNCSEIVPSFVSINEEVIMNDGKKMPLPFITTSDLRKRKTSSLITYRGISKLGAFRKNNYRRYVASSRFLWKTRIHKVAASKLARATKVEKFNSPKYYEKCANELEEKEEIKKEDDTKCSFNNLKSSRFRQTKEKSQRKNKLGHTLSLLESSLQIIREESHSTDSSRCKTRKTEKPNTVTNIKDTQTDFENNDTTKMEEVINYLYSVIEQNKVLNNKIKTSEKYLQTEKFLDSSTETSSYEERFHKEANNVKLNHIFTTIKPGNRKANEVPISNSVQNNCNVKIRNIETKKFNKLSSITTISSSCENTSSTSKTKSLSTENSSPVAISQKHKITKAFGDSEEKIKTKTKSDKAVLKTSKSNFSTLKKFGATSGVNVKVDKNIGTASNATIKFNEIMLISQEQNASEKQFQNQPSSTFIEKVAANDDKTLSKVKSNITTTLKKFEDKSLQTRDYIKPVMRIESILQNNAIYDCLYAEKNVSNSTNSDNNAIIEKVSKSPKQKIRKENLEKPSSTFEKLKRVFGNKEQKHMKNNIMACSISENLHNNRKGQQTPKTDYLNFIKFEKHLEQVLGLYPVIFKAIRAQMDISFSRNTDRQIEEKKSDLCQSKSTLATTVDTVTEYKNTECYDKAPHNNCNVNNDSLCHCCNCYHVWHKKYIVEQYLNSQNFGLISKKQRKAYTKKIEENRGSKYDSTSSMKPNTHEDPKYLKRNRTNSKFVEQIPMQNINETCGLHSVTSIYSNDKGFLTSCSSISLDEKWSVASPLYGRTTSSEDLTSAQQNSLTEKNVSTSSQSLKINKITVRSARRKSKSLIEVSTKKSVNRKLTLKQLLNFNAGIHTDKCQPNILLMSVSSSCTVFTTPSKFLAKVEKHLQFEKTPPPPEMITEAVGEDLINVNILSNEIKCKSKIDERLYHKILFSNDATHLKINTIPKNKRQKPFYIHKISEHNSEQELDSVEINSVVQSPQVQIKNEEDDFSADSLENVKCPLKSCNYNALYTSTTYVKPANQTYLVYSNTVQYDKKLSKHTDRDRRNNNKHRKIEETDKMRSIEVTDQNVSSTLISESGYESMKSKRTASIRNFFRKGGSLLDMFRSSMKSTAKTQKVENQNMNSTNANNLTSFSNLFMKKQELQNVTKKDVGTSFTKDKSSGLDKGNVLDKVYWNSINKDKNVSKYEKKTSAYKSGQTYSTDKKTDSRNIFPEMKLFQTNPLSFSIKSYKKQKDECHAYAEKVLLESQLRKEGYYKQYKDFKEMPLELLIGKKMPCKSKFKHQQTNFVQASPKSTPMSIQTESSTKENKVQGNTIRDSELDKKFEPNAFTTEEKITFSSDVVETNKINIKELVENVVSPSLNVNNRYEQEVHLKSTDERKLTPLNGKTSSHIISTFFKTNAEELGRSKSYSNNSEDLYDAVNVVDVTERRLKSMKKNTANSNPNVLEKPKSDGFHELYIKNSGYENNIVNIAELDQFRRKLDNETPNDSKLRAPEEFESKESVKLSSGTTQTNAVNFAETTHFRLKSRSKTPEESSSKHLEKFHYDGSLKLHNSDYKHRNCTTSIAINTHLTSDTKLKTIGNLNSRICEQLRSERSHGSNSGHRKSIVNIVETTEFNLKSKNKTSENFKSRSSEDLESDISHKLNTDISEQQETTVTVAEVSQLKLKSRSNTSKSKSKSSEGSSKTKSKTIYEAKVPSKSISNRKPNYTTEIKPNCRCKLKTVDTITKKQLKEELVNEETYTLKSVPVRKKQLKEELVNEETDSVKSVSIVSSIVDVLVSNSVTKEIDTENVFKQQTDGSEKSEVNAVESPQEEVELLQEEKRNVSEDFRKGLTDKEVFEKLLDSYEKKDSIAERLSKDEEFFNSQIDSLKKQSDESFDERSKLARRSSRIYTDDHRSTHFWEEKMRQMRTKEDNPVKADDIGVCFARGFRPDNITLSGDACFNLNKQDRLTFSDKMLSDQESIIDFSERETPLDYLLALGFMVDEASNALKDEDIRGRLLAAITEARVWVNKITTTQGTLLYLVAYKSRPRTMRYFLQLVEAIINKRINNAIKLDGFLRILEQVEEGEIQMINILGADRFEDEENEEKIVRKQLKQLFITVYKIAERESIQKGKPLSQESILLLRILAAKYRAGLHPHLELIARYIGQELLTAETQLEAAMIFLSRLDTAEIKLKEFEAYCDIRCEKEKKTDTKFESIEREKTTSKK